jgi:hypothetical protein
MTDTTALSGFPLPGYVASLVNKVQNERMKRVGSFPSVRTHINDELFRRTRERKVSQKVCNQSAFNPIWLLKISVGSDERVENDQALRVGEQDAGASR